MQARWRQLEREDEQEKPKEVYPQFFPSSVSPFPSWKSLNIQSLLNYFSLISLYYPPTPLRFLLAPCGARTVQISPQCRLSLSLFRSTKYASYFFHLLGNIRLSYVSRSRRQPQKQDKHVCCFSARHRDVSLHSVWDLEHLTRSF